MHTNKLLILFAILLALPLNTISQNRLDSLKTLLSKTSSDTLIFDYCYSISLDYIKIAPDSSLKYLKLGLKSIDKSRFTERYYDGINLKGACYWFDNNMDSARDTYIQGLAFSKINHDTNMTAKISNNLAITYQYLSEIDSSEKHLIEACRLYRLLDNKKALAKASLDLGSLYTMESRYDLAIEELLIGLEILEEIDDSLYLIHGYNSIGNLYINIDDHLTALKYYKKSLKMVYEFDKADISDELYCNIGMVYFQDENNYDSAEYYFEKTLSKEGIENNHLLYSIALVNLGALKNNQGKFAEALEYFKIISALDDEQSDPHSKMACYVNMGNTYLELGEVPKARINLEEGLKRSITLSSLEFQKSAYKHLSKCDSIEGKYYSAYLNYKNFHAVEMEIHSVIAEEKISLLNSKNKLTHIKEQNKHLEKQNGLKQALIQKHKYLNALIAFALLLTILILLFTYSMYNKTKRLNVVLQAKNEEISKQKEEFQLLNGQLNKLISIIAHDLKAPFNSLLGLLGELDTNSTQYTEDEKNAIIKSLLQNTRSTYQLLENLMEWSISKTGILKMTTKKVNLLQLINEVLQLNKIQIENKMLVINNQVNPHADVFADRKMTYTILTNLINNAIKFTHSSGIIIISTETTSDFIKIIINDNGIGIEQKYLANIFSIDSDYQMRGTENEYGTGLGLKVVAEFARRMNGKVKVESELNKGTIFTIELPINPN
ncbi:MAG: tetratricopeptide repeat-containing sensor histidine kinase [Bacteroidales bacterium]|nr:tetratricopeptide repeat-containing sensor histidine kinase [Bacteroidales bacterium]